MSEAPFLTTERLELWQPVAGDHAELYALTQDPDIQQFLPPGDNDEADSFRRLLRNAGSWALYGYGPLIVRLAGERPIIGSCGMWHSWRGFGKGMDDCPEAGWNLAPAFWRKGLATEAMRAILDWFDRNHGPRPVVCMIGTGNTASQGVAGKLGFEAYGEHVYEGEDVVLYRREPG